MATTFRFIEGPSDQSKVIAWFQALQNPPVQVPKAGGSILYFANEGPLVKNPDDSIDSKSSPLATILLPREVHGVLWTVGEVHFPAIQLRQRYPKLHKISSDFSKWLKTYECIFSNKSKENRFNYYLEGSIKNYDSPIYALESGLIALQAGRYFVGEGDTPIILEKLCNTLRHRGVKYT